MDISDFEGAEILLDLNQAETPKELVGVVDVILQGGTLENIFHSPHAMSHLMRMVKPGGLTVHTSPVSNFIDHRFYPFSPTFFFIIMRRTVSESKALFGEAVAEVVFGKTMNCAVVQRASKTSKTMGIS